MSSQSCGVSQPLSQLHMQSQKDSDSLCNIYGSNGMRMI